MSSAPFIKQLLTKNIYGINVHFQRSSRIKSFGLLVDENNKPVIPGTTFLAREVFAEAGLSFKSRNHQTWDTSHPDNVSDIILWEDYRNDPNVKEITNKAKADHTVKEGFWISGSGGAASCAGDFAQTRFASKAASTSAPMANLPGGQHHSAGSGILLEVTSCQGVIRVFNRDSGGHKR